MTLSIIMPVYNAQRTLEGALRSLVPQLSPEGELVVVDDGSTDASPEILARFAETAAGYCRVIRQENAGAAAARNTAIACAKGDYLAFMDADDRLAAQAVETILQEVSEGPDILGWDWHTVCDGKSRAYWQAAYSTPEEALKNLMGGTMKWNLWLYAVRRKLVVDNGIRFLEGADMGEDMAFMLKCFASAAKVKQIHEALYDYDASAPGSISAAMNERRRGEVTRNLASATDFLSGTAYKDLCDAYLSHLKLFIKLPLLISPSTTDYIIWYDWFPEANAFAMANPALPLRTRLLQGMAARRLWLLVRLYYRVVYQWAAKLFYR